MKPADKSRTLRHRFVLSFALSVGALFPSAAAEAPATSRTAPLPRPRLTEALRATVENAATGAAGGAAVTMEKVIVQEARLPSGPPKEEQREGKFMITQGGYVLKGRGERFSTEFGLWRHIDIMEEPTDALRQTTRIRMGFLRVSW
jgi:hypothetical protein